MRDKNRNYDEKSTLAVLLEIVKLLVLLLWKGVKAVGRWILKFLKFLLRWVVKGLLAVIDFIIFLSRKIKAFWASYLGWAIYWSSPLFFEQNTFPLPNFPPKGLDFLFAGFRTEKGRAKQDFPDTHTGQDV